MKPREYCCCAVPLINAGIYATLTEQFVLGVLVGTLSVAAPSIVGASTPSFAKWITAIICYVGAGIQVLGFIGVAKEKPILFRRYVTLHGIATIAAFSVTAAWIVLSGTRHSTAQTKCQDDFFGSATGDVASEGRVMCDVFSWLDLGLMAGLWVILGLMQGYLYYVASSYSRSQREDHLKYNNESTNPLTGGIPMTARDPWEHRSVVASRGHEKKDSNASNVSTDQLFSPHEHNPSYPGPAYTQQPQPTPQYTNHYETNSTALGAPQRTQPPFGE